ncbi:MAG TPA: ORF6N domain-containing protein [Verrucomicrobiae bacterium]|nr:ORF6N domain-containing protein [Verrucomicrobiae bacterium]
MLDADWAALYGVTTGNLNKAVKRNRNRFPADFAFQLTRQEVAALRFQFGISNLGRGGRRYLPFVYTEHGAIMAANVLNSKRAAHNERVCRSSVRENAPGVVRQPGTRPQTRRLGERTERPSRCP